MEHDARQRAESYLFPQEFAALRPLLGQYLEQVFATSSFETRFTRAVSISPAARRKVCRSTG